MDSTASESKTVESLKLKLAEHHMKYLQILEDNLQLLQEGVYQAEFCGMNHKCFLNFNQDRTSVHAVVKMFQNFIFEK